MNTSSSDAWWVVSSVGVAREGARWRLTVKEVHRAVPAVLGALAERGAAPTELTTHHASLEDVFMALTGRRLRDA